MAQLLALRFDQVEEHAALHNKRIGDVVTQPALPGTVGTVSTASNGEFTGCEPVDVGPHNVCHRCMPVPGDNVDGRMDPATGTVLVHLKECPELQQAEALEPVPVAWEIVPPLGDGYDDETGTEIGYISEIQVYCEDRKFLLRDVSDVVALETEIIRTSSQTIDDKAMLQYKVYVSSFRQLDGLIRAVCAIPGVKSCERLIAER
jgi:(p)ppGpp synthase/HD superfamily hydrolase